MLRKFIEPGRIEVGIDEVARGCLVGRVYAAAVIWPADLENPLICRIRDSKKLTPIQRSELRQFIEQNAIAWSIGWVDEATIDEINIRNATFRAMHNAIKTMQIENPLLRIDHLLIDGNAFTPYPMLDHTCIVKGDNSVLPIACASILAKTHRDEYLASLARTYPGLHVYGWHKNNGYGTKDHTEAIRIHGISQFHRRTFGICKTSALIEYPTATVNIEVIDIDNRSSVKKRKAAKKQKGQKLKGKKSADKKCRHQ